MILNTFVSYSTTASNVSASSQQQQHRSNGDSIDNVEDDINAMQTGGFDIIILLNNKKSQSIVKNKGSLRAVRRRCEQTMRAIAQQHALFDRFDADRGLVQTILF